jgi:hypothetical protein
MKRNILFCMVCTMLLWACKTDKYQAIPSASIACQDGEILSIEGRFQVSGVYPHLTIYSHGRVNGMQSYAGNAGRRGPEHGGQRESAIGAIAEWGDNLYMITYGAHEPHGSEHNLYIIDKNLEMKLFQESVGGTPAARMVHMESEQLFIGHYAIDKSGNIRVISIEDMPGRMTAIARHLKDPEDMVYYFDMEGMLYEVNVHTLQPTLLYQKPLPGWHGKGAYTAQGRLILANNGEQVPFRVHSEWQVDTDGVYGSENFGILAEYDGHSFNIVERRQYTDVTTKHGIHAIPDDQSPLWVIGWDKRSLRLKVLDNGNWHTYLLPKATNNNDPFHGWFTEWPRIREIHNGKFMMDMHGMFFEFPPTFSADNTFGIRPISSHLQFTTDFMHWNGNLVISRNETSVQGNPLAGQPQSNLWFGDFEELFNWGPKNAYGSVWVEDFVQADEPSLPFLFNGFHRKVLHVINHAQKPVEIVLQFDPKGNGKWEDYKTIKVDRNGYQWFIFDPALEAEWIRLISLQPAQITATFHYNDANLSDGKKYEKMFEGIAPADYSGEILHAKLFPNHDNFNLTLHTGTIENGQFIHEKTFELNKYDFTFAEGLHDQRSKRALEYHTIWYEDEASVVLESVGYRLRLPKGEGTYEPEGLRNLRELASERELANIHGTFYELPLLYVNREPLYDMMRPVATHNRKISDMATWNGLLLLSGIRKEAVPSPHIIRDEENETAVWVGFIEDLWKFGRPTGKGGPWKDTQIKAGELSDKYLMTGYDCKTLQLTADKDVDINLWVHTTHYMGLDLGENPWEQYETKPMPMPYKTFSVPAGQTITYQFPDGFSAYWVQLSPNKDCKATAWFIYE